MSVSHVSNVGVSYVKDVGVSRVKDVGVSLVKVVGVSNIHRCSRSIVSIMLGMRCSYRSCLL